MVRKIYDVEFSVIWDQPRRAFSIKRAGEPTGRFFSAKREAVRVATLAAQFENREGRTVVVYSLDLDRKRVVEWST